MDNPKSNLHCFSCMQNGGKIMRYKLITQFKGSDTKWENLFPCYDSMKSYLEALKPFLQYWQDAYIK